MRPPMVPVLVVLALFAPVAEAQAEASATLSLTDLPTTRVATNDTVYVEKFTVALSIKNVICSQTARLEATPTATPGALLDGKGEPAPSNVSIAFDFTPTKPVFEVPAGQYIATPYSRTIDGTLQVRPSTIPYSGLDVPVTVKAQSPATSACQGQGSIAAEAAAPEFVIRFGRGTEPAPVTPTPQMPAPSLLLGLGALAAVAALTRRRA